MSCTNCGSAFHEKWACSKPIKKAEPVVIEVIGSVVPNGATSASPYPDVGIAKRGRPKIHPDRKAYKAQKERERRAKAKT